MKKKQEVLEAIGLLRGARDRISKQENWCQGVGLKTDLHQGMGMEPALWARHVTSDPNAQFCSLASVRVEKLLHCQSSVAELAAIGALARAMNANIANFNDSHSHAEVIDAFDRAVMLLSEENEEETGSP